VDVSQNPFQEALLRIRKSTISVPFVKKVVRTGGDNGERTCEVMDEEIEQALLLIPLFGVQRFLLLCNVFLNMNPFQKICSIQSKKIWKMYSPQRRDNLLVFYSEGMQRFFLGRDPDPLGYRYIF